MLDAPGQKRPRVLVPVPKQARHDRMFGRPAVPLLGDLDVSGIPDERSAKAIGFLEFHFCCSFGEVWLVRSIFPGSQNSSKIWACIATRYDRCAHTFMSAIALAASVIFWLNQ